MPLRISPPHWNSANPHKTPEILVPHKQLAEVKAQEGAVAEDMGEGVGEVMEEVVIYI
jgi:hypothetical protein